MEVLVGRREPEKEYVGPNRMGGDKLEKEGRRQNMEASDTTDMVERAEGVTVAEEAFVWHMQARRRGRWRTQDREIMTAQVIRCEREWRFRRDSVRV